MACSCGKSEEHCACAGEPNTPCEQECSDCPTIVKEWGIATDEDRAFLEQLKAVGVVSVPDFTGILTYPTNPLIPHTSLVTQTHSTPTDPRTGLSNTVMEIAALVERRMAALPRDEDGEIVRAHESEADVLEAIMTVIVKAPVLPEHVMRLMSGKSL